VQVLRWTRVGGFIQCAIRTLIYIGLRVPLLVNTMEEDTGSIDERTRLLNDTSAASRPPLNALNATNGQKHSSSESSESLVDEEELQYDLARVNSYPTGLGVESGVQEPSAAKSKGYGTVGSQRSTAQEQGTDEDADRISAINEVDDAQAESKFNGVNRGRFWLVFGGILFAYFVRRFTVPFYSKADPIEGCMFRLNSHGIQSSGHYLLFPLIQFSVLVIYGVPIDIYGFSTSFWPHIRYHWAEAALSLCPDNLRSDNCMVCHGSKYW